MPVNVPLILESPSSDPQLRLAVSQLAWMLNSLLRSGQIVMTSPADFAIAVPGVPAGIRYRYSATTADADPGPGRLRLNQAVQNTATRIRVDDLDTYGTNYATVVAAFDDSTATVKGYITLTKEGDPSKVLAFSNGAVANPGGYQNITVTNVASSAASPFADGDYVYLSWQRAGDDGSGGVGSGTVTSVDVDTTAIADLFTITGTPITGSGTETFVNTAQSGNKIWASPANGSSGAWVSRVAVEADLPSTTGFTDVAKTWTAAQTFPNDGFKVLDATHGFKLQIQPGSNLTANRVFSLTTGDANRTLDISAADIAPTAFAATYLDDVDAASFRTTVGLQIGVNVQAYDATLAALAAYNTNGIVCQTAADTFAGRTLTGPAAGITVSNGGGVAGNPTLALANDLAALEGLGSTGLAARTAADTWAQRTLTGPAAGIAVSNGDGASGNPTLALANDLSALEGLGSTGIAVRTAADTWTQRSVAATGAGVSISNGDGVSGNPTVDLDADLDDIAALSPAEGDIMRFASGHWTAVTPTNLPVVVTGISSLDLSGITVNCDGTVSGSAAVTLTTVTNVKVIA